MNKSVKGSWLVHHANKLQGVTSQSGYENTFLAGKAGILLSAISANQQISVSKARLEVLAKAASINTTFELPKLVEVLRAHELVDTSSNGISVLGVTTTASLQHASDIFDALEPGRIELASIELAEHASLAPVLAKEITEELADTLELSSAESNQLIADAESIGFVDVETFKADDKILFNGNLFRRETAEKIKRVLDSLSQEDQRKLNEITESLKKSTCITVDQAQRVLGETLFQKVTAIGLFDISVVSNSTEDVGYLTLPSAFSKYSSSMVDDAFDLAKAFVSSITYGMTKSYYERGQIQMVDALLSALVRGESVGPVQAIAEDYKILELKGVVEVKSGSKKGRVGPMMRLLKKEVGELALQAIRQGDVSEHSLKILPSAAVSKFRGPEQNRERARRKQVSINPKATNDMLSILRTGARL